MFRDGDKVVLQSRNGKELGRYFPELEQALRDELAPRCVLDGEVVVPREIGGRIRLDWESLSQRIHPAATRIKMLAEQTPAHFIGFDALATGDTSLMREPFRVRRDALSESVNEKHWCHVTRTTEDPGQGAQWLDTFEGAGLDGVIAKRLDGPYLPGKREMVKVKHARDADCVAIGYRIHKSGEGVGSILLGLYRDDGELDYVGTAAVAASRHDEILKRIRPLLKGAPNRGFSEPNRWGSGELAQSAVKPKLVVEVRYDKVQGHRFRHGTKLIRFREDKDPEQCTWREVREPPGKLTVAKLLAG